MIMMATTVTYIAVLKGRLANLVHENVGLLNKMNEGLIVLSQDQLTPVFASKPAIRILKEKNDFTIDNSDVSILQQNVGMADFQKKMFGATNYSLTQSKAAIRTDQAGTE